MALIDILFEQARKKLMTETVDHWAEATGVSRNTIMSIRGGNSTNPRNDTKVKIIDSVIGSTDGLMYSTIMSELKMEPSEFQRLHGYTGTYKYVRKDSRGRLATGEVLIESKRHRFVFQHIPDRTDDQKQNKNRQVAHEGYVFLLGRRLTFFGVGPRYTRTLLALDNDTIASEYMPGIVLGTDTKSGNQPMASIFYLAHQSYSGYDKFIEEMIEKYDYEVTLNSRDMIGLLTA